MQVVGVGGRERGCSGWGGGKGAGCKGWEEGGRLPQLHGSNKHTIPSVVSLKLYVNRRVVSFCPLHSKMEMRLVGRHIGAVVCSLLTKYCDTSLPPSPPLPLSLLLPHTPFFNFLHALSLSLCLVI